MRLSFPLATLFSCPHFHPLSPYVSVLFTFFLLRFPSRSPASPTDRKYHAILLHFFSLLFISWSECLVFSGLRRAFLILDEAVQVCLPPHHNGLRCCFFPQTLRVTVRLPSLAEGDATGTLRVWRLHSFARSIADLRTATDH